MGGGKSSSSQSSTSVQTTDTTSASSDGVITGGLIQSAGPVEINNMFPDAVAEAFRGLISLTEKGVTLASDAGRFAVQQVSAHQENTANPELATITRFIPVIMAGIIVMGAVVLLKGK